MKPSYLVVLGVLLALPLSSEARAEDVLAVTTAGDPAAGDNVFIKCSGCHQVGQGAENSIGPELNGLFGRRSGSVPGYEYSDAMKNAGLIWDAANLQEYLKNAKAKVPGTKMVFAGLAHEKDINDLLAYLKQFGPDGAKK